MPALTRPNSLPAARRAQRVQWQERKSANEGSQGPGFRVAIGWLFRAFDGFARRFIDLFQWNTLLLCEHSARLEFRRGLHRLTVQFAKLNRHLAVGGFHGRKFAPQLSPFGSVAANAKCARLTQQQ